MSVVKPIRRHTAEVAVPSEINTKHINAVWAEGTLLGAFAKLSKEFSIVMSVYPSA